MRADFGSFWLLTPVIDFWGPTLSCQHATSSKHSYTQCTAVWDWDTGVNFALSLALKESSEFILWRAWMCSVKFRTIRSLDLDSSRDNGNLCLRVVLCKKGWVSVYRSASKYGMEGAIKSSWSQTWWMVSIMKWVHCMSQRYTWLLKCLSLIDPDLTQTLSTCVDVCGRWVCVSVCVCTRTCVFVSLCDWSQISLSLSLWGWTIAWAELSVSQRACPSISVCLLGW